MLINTTDDSKWIFVLSTSRALYVGQKKKGVFQHSSFLSGGAITAAGRLVALNGVLEAIWPYSGHYLPTEDNFNEFISFLEENNVNLTNVKRHAIDDDSSSFRVTSEEPTAEFVEASETINNDIVVTSQQDNVGSNVQAPLLGLTAKPLSCKWTSGIGARIGCVREYPTELQFQALEHVNLSPRINPGHVGSCGPIPSPRPSPKIRVSPRLAYMGLPSPRVSLTSAC